MTVLGIETSCDESAAAVVRDGREVLSHVVHTQTALHQPFGGVVPEIASRSHIQRLPPLIREAIRKAFCAASNPSPAELPWERVDRIAVTYGPGLASSLIVGVSTAKGLALHLNKPLVGINHIEAHIHSVFLSPDAPDPAEALPMLALVVSGGHTCWFDIPRFGCYRLIGDTLDDAAGEAFDKAAKLLGLEYPGGPAIQRVAGAAPGFDRKLFPKGTPKPDNPALGGLRAELCVSFSGLKTSLMYRVRKSPPSNDREVAELAASYQEAIVTALAERSAVALKAKRYKAFAVGGGVSLNLTLRERLRQTARDSGVPLLLAEPRFCGDNAAMIAGLAGAGGGVVGEAALRLDVTPSLETGLI